MSEPGAAPPRRRRRRRPPPNPLFTRWLREWRDGAAGRHARGVYERALRSLALYPLPLPSGGAAAILRHFGPAICRRLDLRLRQHRAEQGLPPTPPRPTDWLPSVPAPPTKHPRRDYRPLPRSGAHALLLTLHKSLEPLPEAELLRRAQPLCDRPLPPAASRGSLGTLMRRGLLQQSGRPPRWSLTPRGQILAQRLAAAAREDPPPAQDPPEPGERPPLEGEGSASLSSSLEEAPFELRPGEFDIVLCADVTEAKGPLPALLPLPPLLRRLHVGDFLWVAREKDPPPGRHPRELVLDVVIERKSASDLGRSICDGRYREQKFRLRRCGLRQPVYLLEAPQRGEHLPIPHRVLRQAAVSTQVVDGFYVKWTGGPRESAAYLGVLGGHLQQRYGGQVLRAWWGDVAERPPETPGAPCALLPLQRLRHTGGKSQAQTVGGVFALQLLQLGGVSGERAAAILQRYPTPASLMAAYRRCPTPQQREALLSDIKCGPLQRKLGLSLSRTLAQLYGTLGPLT